MKNKKYFEGADIIRDGKIIKDEEQESKGGKQGEVEIEIDLLLDSAKEFKNKSPKEQFNILKKVPRPNFYKKGIDVDQPKSKVQEFDEEINKPNRQKYLKKLQEKFRTA